MLFSGQIAVQSRAEVYPRAHVLHPSLAVPINQSYLLDFVTTAVNPMKTSAKSTEWIDPWQ